MNRKQLDRWCQHGILILIGLMLAIVALAWGGVRISEFIYIQGLSVGVGLLWFVRLLLGTRQRLLWPPLCWAALAFVAYAVARYGWLLHREGVEYLARLELVEILVYALVFFAVVNNLYSQEAIRGLVGVLLVAGSLVAVLAAWQFLTGDDTAWNIARPARFAGRHSGPFLSPNQSACFLALLLPLALAYLLVGEVPQLVRIFMGYVAWIMAVGLALSLSRGAWVATVVSVAILLVLMFRDSKRRLAAGIVLALVVIGAGGFLLRHGSATKRLAEIIPKEEQRDSRLRVWPSAWQMVKQRKLIGWGPAQFDVRYPAFRAANKFTQEPPGHVQNDYLETLVDYGVTGFVLLLLPTGWLLVELVRKRKYFTTGTDDLEVRASNRAAFVLGASLGLLALVVHSLFDSNLRVPCSALAGATLAALLVTHLRYTSEDHWMRLRPVSKWLAVIGVGAVTAYLGWQTVRRGRELYWLGAAQLAGPTTVKGVAALHRAFAVEPRNATTAYAIAEALRQEANNNERDREKLRLAALEWYRRALDGNRFDPVLHARIGEMLHRLGRAKEEATYGWFKNAIILDPNGYLARAQMGWHFFDLDQRVEAKKWFLDSIKLKAADNPLATGYLQLIDARGRAMPLR